MNSFWKGVSLTLISILSIIVLYNIFFSASSSSQKYSKQQQYYYNYLDEQQKLYKESLEKSSKAVDEAQAINQKVLANQERFEKLLGRWEKQTDKFESIISNTE